MYCGLSATDYHRLSQRYARAAANVYSATGSLALSVAPGRIAYAFGMSKAAVAMDTGACKLIMKGAGAFLSATGSKVHILNLT